jgi:hypothetical protein
LDLLDEFESLSTLLLRDTDEFDVDRSRDEDDEEEGLSGFFLWPLLGVSRADVLLVLLEWLLPLSLRWLVLVVLHDDALLVSEAAESDRSRLRFERLLPMFNGITHHTKHNEQVVVTRLKRESSQPQQQQTTTTKTTKEREFSEAREEILAKFHNARCQALGCWGFPRNQKGQANPEP